MATRKTLSPTEKLQKILREINGYIKSEQRHNDFLCRSADGCWDYPNADEKYDMYMDYISISDQKLRKLEKAKEEITAAIETLTSSFNSD